MKYVFVVQNGDGLLLAVFSEQKGAKKMVEEIGHRRWGEEWQISKIKLNQIGRWLLAGCDEYRIKKVVDHAKLA
jgi:hypothetical protein